ncbi:hypothetical protein HAV15_011346 [Penicillium sp. str. |nr:hypothetical protein HAV15_011346 [Penicillium sp. str. \
MAGWWFMLLWVLGPSFANAGVINLAKKTVLSDLSGGFCRSYRFGADIANNVLYMVGLDGGLIPDDGDASNNYLVTLDLTSSFSTSEGKNYKMAKIDTDVPKIKDMAVWSNAENSTLYQYGGRFLENITSEDTIWTYTTKDRSWSKQDGTIQPSRLEYGVYTNAPAIQAGFWIGGYRASVHSSRWALDGPYEAVEEGSLSYVPVGDKGIVYIGGDVPSIKDGINVTMSASTMGTVASRTQFCASVQHDESSSSYQIYVLGGADLKSKDTILDVSLGIGGRLAWAEDGQAGCYDAPAFIYDAQSEVTRSSFDVSTLSSSKSSSKLIAEQPTLSSFSLSSSTASDIKTSPSPSSWADPALKTLFGKSAATTSTTANNKPSSTSEPQEINTSGQSTKGAIAGGVVGGVAGLALIIGLLWFFVARNKKQKNAELAEPKLGEAEFVTHQVQPMPELPVGARDGRAELRGESHMRWELPVDHKREIPELDSGRNS